MQTQEANNLSVLSTAIQLISDIALEVIGNDIAAYEVDGQKITQSSVKVLAAADLNKTLSEVPKDA